MKVSIITVCYNSQDTIKDTIESIEKQIYPDIEHIIIDGGSTDNTLQIINDKSWKRIRHVVSEPDQGIYDAMNKGIGLASGDVIGFLNSDDMYVDKNVIQRLMDAMMGESVDSVYSDLLIVDPNNINKVMRYYDSSWFKPSRFRFGLMPAHPTFLIKREYFDKEGGFSLDYLIASDFELLIRFLYKKKASFKYVPFPLVKMRAGGISTAGLRQSYILNKEIVNACRANGIWTSFPLVLLKIPIKLSELIKGRRMKRLIIENECGDAV